MIKKFDLIAGTKEEIKEYIENLSNFKMWQFGKSYNSQIDSMFRQTHLSKHIGFVTYQGENENSEVIINAVFIAVLNKNRNYDGNVGPTADL